jgi:hypothetical protein
VTPIAELMHAAGANTNNNRIMIDEKYILITVYKPMNMMLLLLFLKMQYKPIGTKNIGK